jgi:hypothetical protein
MKASAIGILAALSATSPAIAGKHVCPKYKEVRPSPDDVGANACGYWASELVAERFYYLHPQNHIEANQMGSTTKAGEKCWTKLMRECDRDKSRSP